MIKEKHNFNCNQIKSEKISFFNESNEVFTEFSLVNFKVSKNLTVFKQNLQKFHVFMLSKFFQKGLI